MSSEGSTTPKAGGRRESYVEEAHIETLGRQLKRARVGYKEFGTFTFFCDEPPTMGGDYSAPAPLMYFTSGLGL